MGGHVYLFAKHFSFCRTRRRMRSVAMAGYRPSPATHNRGGKSSAAAARQSGTCTVGALFKASFFFGVSAWRAVGSGRCSRGYRYGTISEGWHWGGGRGQEGGSGGVEGPLKLFGTHHVKSGVGALRFSRFETSSTGFIIVRPTFQQPNIQTQPIAAPL